MELYIWGCEKVFMAPKFSFPKFLFLLLLAISNTLCAQVYYENAFPKLSFNFPVEMQAPPDGSNRLCVVEQPGIIKVFGNSPTTLQNEISIFLNITDRVAYSAGQEIGLLGLAFHPQFISNGYVYIYYIDEPDNYRINIVRYTVSSENQNVLDPDSEFIIAQFTKNQNDSNHNGGKIAFGPDGYLYISVGDGGGGGDPQKNGQNLETVFGSILRIDVDVNGDNPTENNPELPNGNYEIPEDNPRVNNSGLDELYAWGIRNTWKFSFDSTGRLWGADVGANTFEEINLITKGGNFGWNKFEALDQPSYGSNTTLATTPVIDPILYYGRDEGDVSITGGYTYKGSLRDERLRGSYIYGDFVSGRVWALRHDPENGINNNELLFKTSGEFISSFGEDEDGELYFLGYRANANIYRITGTTSESTTTTVEGIGEWQEIGKGTNGTIHTLAQNQDGEIYVGGDFTLVGELYTNNLGKIDINGNWSVFTEGANGPIHALAVTDDGRLFAGGDFSEIGGISANNIAYFDGTAWNPMKNGTNGPISKIILDHTENTLYVGGVFTTAGSYDVNYIAKWENDTWQGLVDNVTGTKGTNNEIRSLAIDDDNVLYVGGNFDSAGGIDANRIASWDGKNWKSLGDGTSGFVQSIVTSGDYIYAGGNFVSAGNKTVNRIARFNLTTKIWEPLGNGLSGNVNDIIVKDSYIYVTGAFETASDTDNVNEIMNNVARWSINSGWEALGPGTNVGINTLGNVLYFYNESNELIVGGNFNRSGALMNTNNISKWSVNFSSELVDNDGDGVDDDIDECPDTPPDTNVSENGCPDIITFDPDQFTIKAIETSCIGSATGQINIESKSEGEYIALLTGNNSAETLNFNRSLLIEGLAPGTYNLCLEAANGDYYEVCSLITIEEPEPISVLTSMDFFNRTLTLELKGSSKFTISLNNKKIESNLDIMTLPLDKTTNELIVTSNEGCQGSYSETIILEDAISVFPNPFKNKLNIELPKMDNEIVEVQLFDIHGKVVYSDNLLKTSEGIIIRTDHLNSGFYFVQLGIENVKRIFKVLKS